MKISVVIPARNEANYIENCLLALKQQTREPYEVIVVDNGSSDETATIAGRLGATVLFESKVGIVHARNCGFNAASGNVIARIDADSVVPTDWLQSIAAVMENSATAAVTGPALFYDVPLPMAFSWLYRLLVFDFNRLLLGHNILWGSNMAVRKEAWDTARSRVCNSGRYHEDLDLGLVLSHAGFSLVFEPRLAVLASMRRLYGSGNEFRCYIAAWYATLRLHSCKTLNFEKLVGTGLVFAQPAVAWICLSYLSFKFRLRHWFVAGLDLFAQ